MPSSWSHLPTFNILLPLKIVQGISSDRDGDRTLSSSCRVSHKLTCNNLPFWCCLLCSIVQCRLIFNHFLECRSWSGLWECETGGHICALNELQSNYMYKETYLHFVSDGNGKQTTRTIHLKFTSAVPFAKLALLDPINLYLYCAVLYQWKIPVFIVIFMQSLVYIICIVSNEYIPD